MNLHGIDWVIVGLFLVALIALTLYCRRYVQTIADFLAAGRVAGRYLLTVSTGLGGAISIIASWEMLYAAGLPTQWWAMMSLPVSLILALTGFITYRFRQTRALTLAQFFEMRYSRRFRFFAGLLCWFSGVMNYGIFPAVTARFFIVFFGFNENFSIGSVQISTFPVVMAAYLSLALFTALTGGQISIMITDFFQGLLTLILFSILLIFMFQRFAWDDLVAGLQMAPANHSLINPFKTDAVSDFNIWYFLIAIFGQIYNLKSWQGNSGYNAAARTPHEARMAGVLSSWRTFVQAMCLLLIPLAAYAVLHHPRFAQIAAPIQAQLSTITDERIRNQTTVPIFLTHILPAGFLGLFGAILLAAAVSCDNTYIHSWGSIFIQDVILPLRKKPLSVRQHMLMLRLSILGVAVFGFTFSMLFPLKQYVLMFFALTGAIYLGGAGAVIIGGLYWKRGTTSAAWTALISGSLLAGGGMLVQNFWQDLFAPILLRVWPDHAWLTAHSQKFPVNGQIIYFVAMATASILYVSVSLLGRREIYDLDRLLHRGPYAVAQDHVPENVQEMRRWYEILGISRDFTRGEKILFWATFGWSMGWWGIFLAGCLWQFLFGISDKTWSWFWWCKIWLSGFLGIGLSFWLIWGGVRDARRMFVDLRGRHRSQSPEDMGLVAETESSVLSKKTAPADSLEMTSRNH